MWDSGTRDVGTLARRKMSARKLLKVRVSLRSCFNWNKMTLTEWNETNNLRRVAKLLIVGVSLRT